MMDRAIRDFAKQFAYEPSIENEGKLQRLPKTLVLGMGGSHLAADLLSVWNPALPLRVHSDYGLPAGDLADTLVIASSYSGNTEEVLDGYAEAKRQGLPLAVIAVGGELIARARADAVPYVQMPDTGIQPRSALGFSLMGLLALMGLEGGLKSAAAVKEVLDPESLEEDGKKLAMQFTGKVPVIYSSRRNLPIAYNWKIKLNETGKIPAFSNVFPELNHNEMQGFDVQDSTRNVSGGFRFIFLKDGSDHPRVQKRMEIVQRLYRDRGFAVDLLALEDRNVFLKIFRSLVLADWFAFHTATRYGLEPEQVPMVEEFKGLMKD